MVFYPEPEPSEIILADREQNADSIPITAARLHHAAKRLDELHAKQKGNDAAQS